jgi:hypothetical protein
MTRRGRLWSTMPMTTPRISVSANRRYLNTSTGASFFWLGDTAWELFHRLTREEIARYCAIRARQRFNVIQAVALAEFEGLTVPNAYGHLPLIDLDPTRPNAAYFEHVDAAIAIAAQHGLTVALLPTWGDKVARGMWGDGPQIFDAANARVYGRWLGARYKTAANLLWMIGGDRPVLHGEHDDSAIWRAMAEGVREGIPDALMTFHIMGGHSSGEDLHQEAWLDVNSMQSGHGSGRDTPVWELIAKDYARAPVKPVFDSEPNYEDHPVDPWPVWKPENGYFRDYDVRKQSYRSVFAGGCGVTYGHHSMWQFLSPERARVNHPECYWTEAITRPGAEHMRHLRELMESLPYFTRIPDQGLLIDAPTDRHAYIAATRDSAGAYALAYLPNAGQQARFDLSALRTPVARASWVDPRTGDRSVIGDVDTRASLSLVSPARGPDWVVLFEARG